MKKISTAVIQINAGPDKKRNLDNAARLIKRASRNGARLVALPELFNWRGTKKDFDKNSEPLSGCTYKEMSDLASSLNIFIHCGSILEANPRSKKPFNTSFLLSPEGKIFIIAPNQYGKGPSSTLNYGHSMIVDPWGTIIARCQNGERIIYADLDLSYLKRVRKKLPVLNGIIA